MCSNLDLHLFGEVVQQVGKDLLIFPRPYHVLGVDKDLFLAFGVLGGEGFGRLGKSTCPQLGSAIALALDIGCSWFS